MKLQKPSPCVEGASEGGGRGRCLNGISELSKNKQHCSLSLLRKESTMLYDILFVIFFFFTCKQLYAGTHFTGSSSCAAIILRIISIFNLLLEFAFLIWFSVKGYLSHAIILLLAGIIFTLVINRIIARSVLKKMDTNDIDQPYFMLSYSRQCDVVSVMCAWIGFVVNTAIIVVFVVRFL